MRLHLLAVPLAVIGLGTLLLIPTPGTTQDPPPAAGGAPDNFEVLARGPVHEAYANPLDYTPEPGPVAAKAPPEPIEELPPDQKPEGDDVEWIPGYWAWEAEEENYLWVSGFWRDMPPGRRWVPGTWQEAADGYHWTPGFWAAEEQETIEYVPPPPRNIDAGPSVRPANETDVYVPGCWVYQETRYFWRPGYWVEYRPDWVWVPAHYVWTPGGCIFVEGYWDRPFHLRGMLFAPIRPRVDVVAFVYRPTFVIQTDFLLTAMFVGPARRHYYFGDYFEERYERRGFVAWMNYHPVRRAPDPIFAYYRSAYRAQPAWGESLTALYAARRSGAVARPPRTLVQQNTVINNITTNNTTNVNVVKNVNVTNIQNVTVIRPITQVNNTEVTALASLTPEAPKASAAAPRKVVKMTQVNNTQVNETKERVQQIRNISKQRRDVEARLIADPPAKGTAERPRPAARLELPKQAAPRAAAKKSATDPATPAAKTRPQPPAPPPVPKQTERQAPPKEDKDPAPPIRPPTGTTKDTPPGKAKDPRPLPKKDRDDDPLPKRPPMKDKDDPLPKKGPVAPKKDRDDDPIPKRPPVKDRDDPPVPKKAPTPPRPPVQDQDDDPPPAKKAPMPKLKDPPAVPKAPTPPRPPVKDKDDDDPPAKKGPVPKKKDKDG